MADLDIIIPVYNPKPYWENIIVEAISGLMESRAGLSIHTIIINDGSDNGNFTDQQIRYLEESIGNITCLEKKVNQGKGEAIREASKYASSDVVIFTDVDFPYPNESILTIYDLIKNGQGNIVTGEREVSYGREVPYLRRLLSGLFRDMNKLIFSFDVSDSQAGIKAFDKKGLKLLQQTKIKSYLFDLELLILAERELDLKLISSPVTLKKTIEISNFSSATIWKEIKNYITLIGQYLF